MKLKTARTWIVASLVVIGLVALGVTLPGCSDTPESKSKESKAPKAPEIPEVPEVPKPPEGPADSPPADVAATVPDVSKFSPAEDLVAQVEYYIKDLDKAVASEEDYVDSAEKISRHANTLTVIALGLGLHDQDNKHKASAGSLMKSAQKLAATTDFASAKAGVEAVKKAAAGGDPAEGELKWEKVASMPALMKQVPLVNTKLKRCLKRIERMADEGRGHAATIAVIAQGSVANVGDTQQPDEVDQWEEFCAEMRDAAAEVGAGIRAADSDQTNAAMARLGKSCDTCHEVFHPDEE